MTQMTTEHQNFLQFQLLIHINQAINLAGMLPIPDTYNHMNLCLMKNNKIEYALQRALSELMD
jgi:hypothetical protein